MFGGVRVNAHFLLGWLPELWAYPINVCREDYEMKRTKVMDQALVGEYRMQEAPFDHVLLIGNKSLGD